MFRRRAGCDTATPGFIAEVGRAQNQVWQSTGADEFLLRGMVSEGIPQNGGQHPGLEEQNLLCAFIDPKRTHHHEEWRFAGFFQHFDYFARAIFPYRKHDCLPFC